MCPDLSETRVTVLESRRYWQQELAFDEYREPVDLTNSFSLHYDGGYYRYRMLYYRQNFR